MAIREYIRESKGLPAERARFTSYVPKPVPTVDSRPYREDGKRVAVAFMAARVSTVRYDLEGLTTWFSQVLSGRSEVPGCFDVSYDGNPEKFGTAYAQAANAWDARGEG